MPPVLFFILYKYFPYGGLQRDFLRIANSCRERVACRIVVLTMTWDGEIPEGWHVEIAPRKEVRAFTQVGRYQRFTKWTQRWIARFKSQSSEAVVASHETSLKETDPLPPRTLSGPDSNVESIVIGFNKMPGLDIYYAADPCFAEKAGTLRGRYYKFTPRFRHFMDYERAVFSSEAATQILLISEIQQAFFEKHYRTPRHRLHMLPPGVSKDRSSPVGAGDIRAVFRKEFQIEESDILLLALGSDFRRKGLDRTLRAIASIPSNQRGRIKLFVVGRDNPGPFLRLARRLGVLQLLTIFPGRDDVPRFLLGADLLLHPAYHENTGTVILEALAAGLPVITTANCGYSHYVRDAEAGVVLQEPFDQQEFNRVLTDILNTKSGLSISESTAASTESWSRNALEFSRGADIYTMPERAAEIILSNLHRRTCAKSLAVPA